MRFDERLGDDLGKTLRSDPKSRVTDGAMMRGNSRGVDGVW